MKKKDMAENYIGHKFFRLLVLEINRNGKKVRATCLCDCGKNVDKDFYSIKAKRIKSCGCYNNECRSLHGSKNKKHGHSSRLKERSRAYKTWASMLRRCYTPSASGFKKYGAKGVTVCDEWRNSFEKFLQDMGEPPESLSIDRIDNLKGYSKENCRWANSTTQARNRSNNILIEKDGKNITLAEFIEGSDLNYQTVLARYYRGWKVKDLLKPIKNGKISQIENSKKNWQD